MTLATQLTVDRLQVLERVLVNWPGPASITLHARDAELQAAMDVILSSATIRRRTNVDLHVVYRRLVHHFIIARQLQTAAKPKAL